MPRPFWRESKQAWYLQVGKRQISLGREREKADEKYGQIMADRQQLRVAVTAVTLLFERYLDWCKRERDEKTYDWYVHFLTSFAKTINKRLTIHQIEPHHVDAWIAERYADASDTTRFQAMSAIQRPFSWGVRQKLIKLNPLIGLEKPTAGRREFVVSHPQYQQILEITADEDFRDLVVFLWETGARPQEVRLVEMRHFQADASRIVFPKSESKGKKFPRVIYLNDVALEICQRRVHGDGRVFLNTQGNPWNKSSLNCRFRRLKAKIGEKGLCCYSLRHSYATHALEKGIDPVTLSVLMGHADPSMIAKVYQHLAKNPEYLREAAKRARA